MQERNAEECEVRIWVYPSIALHCDKHQHKGDA